MLAGRRPGAAQWKGHGKPVRVGAAEGFPSIGIRLADAEPVESDFLGITLNRLDPQAATSRAGVAEGQGHPDELVAGKLPSVGQSHQTIGRRR